MYPSVIVGLLLGRGYIKLSQSNGKKPDSKKTVSSVVSDCSPKIAKICLISITFTLPLSPFKSNTSINGENIMHVWVKETTQTTHLHLISPGCGRGNVSGGSSLLIGFPVTWGASRLFNIRDVYFLWTSHRQSVQPLRSTEDSLRIEFFETFLDGINLTKQTTTRITTVFFSMPGIFIIQSVEDNICLTLKIYVST